MSRYMSARVLRFGIAAVVAAGAAAALWADIGRAGSRGIHPVLRQVTRNTVGDVTDIGLRLERGETIVFTSDGDVLGPGSAPGHREVYLYRRVPNMLQRITNTTGGESYAPVRETDETYSRRPKYVAFVSTGDLDPGVGNADGNPEIFLYLTETGAIRQITDTPSGVTNAEPYSSDGGQCIVWRSNGDLEDNNGSDPQNPGAGYSNGDGSDEIFMLRFADESLDGWVTTQVSNGPAGTTSSNPVVGGYWFTRQCRSITYQSGHDQLGNGSTGSHIYNYTKLSGATEQLTNAGEYGISVAPAISGASSFARGPFVVFHSSADILGNGSSGFEIFRHRLFSFEEIQYTYSDVGESRNAAISDGGGYIAFESTSELFDPNKPVRGVGTYPFNGDGNAEIYRTKGRRRIWQITRSSGCENTQPSIHDSGDIIAFASTCDLVPGNNPGGIRQVFFYQEVQKGDPFATSAGCAVSQGCCNVANGCYQPLLGRQKRPPRVP